MKYNFKEPDLKLIASVLTDEWVTCSEIGVMIGIPYRRVGHRMPSLVERGIAELKYRRVGSDQTLQPLYRIKRKTQT